MTQEDREALAKVAEMYEKSKVILEVGLAGTLRGILALRPEDVTFLRQEARAKPTRSAELVRAADLLQRIGPIRHP